MFTISCCIMAAAFLIRDKNNIDFIGYIGFFTLGSLAYAFGVR